MLYIKFDIMMSIDHDLIKKLEMKR